MNQRTICDFCEVELDLGREFIYQFESLNFIDNEFVLEHIRRDYEYHGEPLRLCKDCSNGIKQNQSARLAEQQEAERQGPLRQRIFIVGFFVIAFAFALMVWFGIWRI